MEKDRKMENYNEEEEIFNQRISSNIKYLRMSHFNTQKDLALICDVGENAIGHYEANRRTPVPLTLKKIADYYNISLDDLMKKDLKMENIKEITPLEFSNQTKVALMKTGKLSDNEKAYIISTLDLVCKRDD